MSKEKLQSLQAGYQKYRNETLPNQKALLKDLVENGQHPEYLLLSCCDSRVDGAHIFSADPGSLFTIRNVANMVPPKTYADSASAHIAAIEYAVTALKIKTIIIMGHAYCGGVKAAYDTREDVSKADQASDTGFTLEWVNSIKESAKEIADTCSDCSVEDQLTKLEQKNVMNSVSNLMEYDFIKKAVDAGELNIVGSWFDLDQAEVLVADEAGSFTSL